MGKTITDKISDANTLENEVEYALQNAVAGFYHLVFQQAEKQIVLKHLRLQGPE
jgi:hypothetical protein